MHGTKPQKLGVQLLFLMLQELPAVPYGCFCFPRFYNKSIEEGSLTRVFSLVLGTLVNKHGKVSKESFR